jgi:Zn-dependent protease with chaperone function
MADATRARRGHIEPLWDRIERNRLKTGAFLAVFVGAAGLSAALFVAVAGVFLGVVLVSRSGTDDYFSVLPYLIVAALVVGAAVAVIHVVRMLTRPERRLPKLFGAVRSETGTLIETKSALHDMALAAGFRHSPPLWVIDECERVNAFALGMSEETAIVGVTRGFTERLSADSQRAVFANLMARLAAGGTFSATVISAILGPIWENRAARLRGDEGPEDRPTSPALVADMALGYRRATDGVAIRFLLGFLAVALTEALMAGHERASLAAAEKADAEGMLLLKDPSAMLRALEDVLEANNTVPGAGEAYSMLFYCWAGFGYAPEDDPEMERIGRLREVLGAQGAGV